MSSACHGYEAEFVSDVWDELKCIICHLVLKQPLQHMTCGHRYCTICFHEMQNYSKRLNMQLICPVDRQLIDLGKVFEDNGIHRTIRALDVRCKQHEVGCTWVGCLSDLEEHVSRCQYQRKQDGVLPTDNAISGNDEMYKQLIERMRRCEEVSVQKEKELASLRFSMKEMKDEMRTTKEVNKRLVDDIETVGILNKEMAEEMKTMKDEMKTMKELNRGMQDEIQRLKQADESLKKEYTAEIKSLDEFKCRIEEDLYKERKQDTNTEKDIESCKQYVGEKISSLEKKIENVEIIGKHDVERTTSSQMKKKIDGDVKPKQVFNSRGASSNRSQGHPPKPSPVPEPTTIPQSTHNNIRVSNERSPGSDIPSQKVCLLKDTRGVVISNTIFSVGAMVNKARRINSFNALKGSLFSLIDDSNIGHEIDLVSVDNSEHHIKKCSLIDVRLLTEKEFNILLALPSSHDRWKVITPDERPSKLDRIQNAETDTIIEIYDPAGDKIGVGLHKGIGPCPSKKGHYVLVLLNKQRIDHKGRNTESEMVAVPLSRIKILDEED